MEKVRRRGERVLLVGASAVVLFAGLKAARAIAVPFMVAFFLATLSLPVLAALRARRVPAALAVVVTLLLDVAVITLLVVLVSGSVQGFTEALPNYLEAIYLWVSETVAHLRASGIDLAQVVALEKLTPSSLMEVASGTVVRAWQLVSGIGLVFLTVVFILFEAAGFVKKASRALGIPHHEIERYGRIVGEVQHFLAIKTLVSLATGLLAGLWVALIGVEYAALWGLTAFLMNYIPTLGSIIAAVPPVLLALLLYGPGRGLAVIAGYLAINVVLGNVIEPHLMGRRLGLSPLVVFVSLVFWGWLWGPIGMLLSVPLTMVVKILLLNTEDMRWIALLLAAKPEAEDVAPPIPSSEG